ncbi:MAG: helix-turn-helix transcriptional regulator [Bacteroidetes bacterium]|nr:helix-turn-helix transcriptional regulator [Bacteroidota bacterium]
MDLIGERWTLILIRHLLSGPRGFQELRTRTGIGPRILTTRLRQLSARGFVEPVLLVRRSLYTLTKKGRPLEPVVRARAARPGAGSDRPARRLLQAQILSWLRSRDRQHARHLRSPSAPRLVSGAGPFRAQHVFLTLLQRCQFVYTRHVK